MAKTEYRDVKQLNPIADLDSLFRDFRDHRPMKPNTAENYRQSIRYLKIFMEQEMGTSNPGLDEFDVRVLTRFTLWFRKNGKNGTRANTYVENVRWNITKLFRYAKKMKIIDHYPFEDYDSPLESTVKHAADLLDRKVTRENLDAIANTTIGNKRIERARLMFLFQRWTGMGWVDMNHYGARIKDCLRKDLSGRAVLSYNRVKTGEPAIVPLFQETTALLEKLNYEVSPGPSRTYFDQIRNLFEYLDLPTEGMGAHTGRHVFGSEMLEMGFTMEAVSRMMGHSTIKETEKVYAQINSDKIFADVERIKKIHDVFERKEGLPPVKTAEIQTETQE